MEQAAIVEDAGDVGDEENSVCPEPDRESDRGFVRVDIQRAAGERRDDGDATGCERVFDGGGRVGTGSADQTELR